MKFFNTLLEIFFPANCVSCGHSVPTAKDLFCSDCLLNLHFTNYYSISNNEMTRRLIALKSLKYAVSLFYFTPGSPIQKLLYKIKYYQRAELAERISHLLATFLESCLPANEIDCVTCVPLHPAKQRQRGFNQSEILARAVASTTGIPFRVLLERTRLTETQTHFGRLERLENQYKSIICSDAIKNYKHILLIDDVMTTGATTETCSDSLISKNPDLKISIATLTIADHW